MKIKDIRLVVDARTSIKSWLSIIIGSLLTAAGFVFFINPYNIVPGGVYGASIIMHNLIPDIQVGTFGYIFEIPLLLLAFFCLGKGLGAKTVIASLITPVMMNGLTALAYPTAESMRTLDPSLMLGGALDLSDQLIVAVIMGPTLVAVGAGIIIKAGASGGGTDIVAMLMQKFLGIRFSNAILIADGTVVLSGFLVSSFILGGKGLVLSCYSLIAIYLMSRVVARVINGAQDDKIVWVITNAEALPALRKFILEDMDRTATYIPAKGLYSRHDMELLMMVVHYKDIQTIKSQLKQFDPRAFVIVSDAYDAYGEGWKTLPNINEVQFE